MLTELGHRAISVSDAASALRSPATGPADILVTDVGLPGVSGAGPAKRTLKRRPDLGIVFATGDEAVSAEHDLKRAVMLVKPYAEEDLAQALVAAVSKSRLDAAE